MEHTFENRAECMREIRDWCGDDAWRARYALFAALGLLDLEGVNEVRRALYADLGLPREAHDVRLRLLLQERWG